MEMQPVTQSLHDYSHCLESCMALGLYEQVPECPSPYLACLIEQLKPIMHC